MNNSTDTGGITQGCESHSFSLEILTEQVKLIYRHIPIYVAGALVCVPIILLIFWGEVSTRQLVAWCCLVVAGYGGIFLSLYYQFKKNGLDSTEITVWARRYRVSAVLRGAIWGSSGVLLFVPESPTHQLVLFVVICLSLVAAVASQVAYRPAFFAYLPLAVIPYTLRSVFEGGLISYALALGMAFLSSSLLLLYRDINAAFVESLRLRFENQKLALALFDQKETAEHAKEEALKATKAKSNFLAAASHDLRQPLHAHSMFMESLEVHIQGEEAKSIFDDMKSSLAAMSGLLNALLDISKLDAGVVSPDVRGFPVAVLLRDIQEAYTSQAEQKGIKLRVVLSCQVIHSDPVLLKRIVNNLVDNAIKYTTRGGVVIGCRRKTAAVRIEVWDTGDGVPDDEQKKIFQEYHQLSNPERDREKGLGLGLAIVSRFGRLLGHKVELRSWQGKGSCFSVTVSESEIVPEGIVADVVTELITRPLSRATVLVIDDNRMILNAARNMLTDWGCTVVASESAADAIRQLRANRLKPDVVLADYRLREGCSGIEAIQQIETYLGQGTRGIIITGDTASERLREASQAGYELLHKPVNPASLNALLSYMMTELES